MILLSDNDIIHKLAAFDLLDDALPALGATADQVYVLPTAKFKFGIAGRRSGAKKIDPVIVARIAAFLKQVREIDWDAPVPSAFQNVTGIDGGEAILFSALVARGETLLATGDKRSLRALASDPACATIAAGLRGRVVSLEQIIRRIIDARGLDFVKARVVPASNADRAIDAAFGSGMQSTKENVESALAAYIAEIRAFAVDLLVTDTIDMPDSKQPF